MPHKEPNTATLQQPLGPICKVIMAGEVLGVSPSTKHKGRLLTPWTLMISGDTGPYSLTVADDAGIRVAERLHVGDFIVAEATLVPKGARCEIKALLIQSNRESRLPVISANPAHVPDTTGTDAEGPNTEGLPWEDVGS